MCAFFFFLLLDLVPSQHIKNFQTPGYLARALLIPSLPALEDPFPDDHPSASQPILHVCHDSRRALVCTISTNVVSLDTCCRVLRIFPTTAKIRMAGHSRPHKLYLQGTVDRCLWSDQCGVAQNTIFRRLNVGCGGRRRRRRRTTGWSSNSSVWQEKNWSLLATFLYLNTNYVFGGLTFWRLNVLDTNSRPCPIPDLS